MLSLSTHTADKPHGQADHPARPSAGPSPKTPPRERLGVSPLMHIGTWAFYGLIASLLYDGWVNRHDQVIHPETGVGYALGIVGGVMMLVMMLYPMRKRLRVMRRWGAVKHWFRMHMLFGVLGPCLILYHSNFSLGSLNSRVALFSMLLVAGSGLLGRYIYTRVHYSLYGNRATLLKLRTETDGIRQELNELLGDPAELNAALEAYERRVVAPPRGVVQGAWRHLSIGLHSRWFGIVLRRRIARVLKQRQQAGHLDRAGYRRSRVLARHYIQDYLGRARKVAELGFYERLFSLWHVLHVPLFIMLVITGVVHVFAVHMY